MSMIIANGGEQLKVTAGTTMQNLAVADAAVAFETFAAATTHVLVSCDTNDVMVTFDGTAPVATTNGHLLTKGLAPEIWVKERAQVAQFIRQGSSGYVRATELSI